MKEDYTIESSKYEFIRDFSGIGNPIMLSILALISIPFPKVVLLIIGLISVELFGNLIKFIFFKNRPNKHVFNNWYSKLLASSFPSLHVARVAFFVLFFLSIKLSIISILFGLFLITLVSFSRIRLGKHDFIDVIGGIALSILVFLLIN